MHRFGIRWSIGRQ